MPAECPGRRNVRHLSSVQICCPGCGTEVEIFTDEARTRCRCGEVILRESIPSCVQWCPSAEACLGQVIDLRTVRKRMEEVHGPDAERYVQDMGRRIRESGGTAAGGLGPQEGQRHEDEEDGSAN